MSYILDALRRADAERERGAVPSLHTQQYGALPGDDDGPERPLVLIGVIVVLALALGGALAWHFWGGSDSGTRLAAQGVVPAPLPTAPAAPALGASAAAVPVLPLPAVTAASLPSTAVPATAPAPSTSAETKRRRKDTATATANAPEPKAAARTPTAATPAASSPASGADAGSLPDALRRELPALAFGGASYSKDPASRMVIFNGRVFHEGDTIAPQLVLQQIKLKAAVLTYKGYRYEIGF
jgi:general secretion pathway protein B